MKDTQVIILAAGKGTRMKSNEPKALTMLKGKPFLAHILHTLNTLGFEIHPIIVIGHMKERIKEVLGNELTYVEQDEPLGTGHAVASTRESVDKKANITLVLSTDQPMISKETIEELLSLHYENKPAITIATFTVADFEEWRRHLGHFGRIIRNEDNTVKEIVEYKDAGEKEKMIKELNAGVYAFNSEWLWKNINLLRNENKKKEYYLTDLIQIASQQGKKIEAVSLTSTIEGIQPNTKEEVDLLEKLIT